MTSPCTLASAARVLVTVVDTRGWQAIARPRRTAGWLWVDWEVIEEWEGRGMMSCTCVKLASQPSTHLTGISWPAHARPRGCVELRTRKGRHCICNLQFARKSWTPAITNNFMARLVLFTGADQQLPVGEHRTYGRQDTGRPKLGTVSRWVLPVLQLSCNCTTAPVATNELLCVAQQCPCCATPATPHAGLSLSDAPLPAWILPGVCLQPLQTASGAPGSSV